MRCEQVFTIPILLSIPLGLLGGYHNTKIFLSLLGPIGAKNASFLSQFYAKPICLPTQARDTQKETLKKEMRFTQVSRWQSDVWWSSRGRGRALIGTLRG